MSNEITLYSVNGREGFVGSGIGKVILVHAAFAVSENERLSDR